MQHSLGSFRKKEKLSLALVLLINTMCRSLLRKLWTQCRRWISVWPLSSAPTCYCMESGLHQDIHLRTWVASGRPYGEQKGWEEEVNPSIHWSCALEDVPLIIKIKIGVLVNQKVRSALWQTIYPNLVFLIATIPGLERLDGSLREREKNCVRKVKSIMFSPHFFFCCTLSIYCRF